MSVTTAAAWLTFSDEIEKAGRIDTYGLHYSYNLNAMLYKYMIIKALELNDDNSHYTADEVALLESQLAENCNCTKTCNC